VIWRIELGNAVLYGIRDGQTDRDALEFLIGSSPEELARYPHYLNDDGTMTNSFSCYLFDTGSTRVLIDTGFGYNAPGGVGEMPGALETLGVAPGDIDHVVFTHMHPDHILGSLDADQAPLFANASHSTLKREVEHWRGGTDDRSAGISRVAGILDGAGLLHAAEEPGQIVPGVTTFATYGHSPGHTAVRLSSGDDELVITGDVTFTPIQIDHTDWNLPFDGDKELAAATRREFFDMLAETGVPYVAGHYVSPGHGRVVVTAEGRRYEALPVTEIG
jgi:glyoxylase-like metal-dependent hydrolase (beta-lactamase superfamily II)